MSDLKEINIYNNHLLNDFNNLDEILFDEKNPIVQDFSEDEFKKILEAQNE